MPRTKFAFWRLFSYNPLMSEEKINGFTITNHFLKFKEATCNDRKEYRVPWDEPNIYWKIRKVQGSRQLITNIQYDESPHAPDLFLYTNITNNEDTNAYRVAEDSIESINGDRRWYVKQVTKRRDRVGMQQFTTLPLGVFISLWRKAIPTTDLSFGGKAGRGLCPIRVEVLSSEEGGSDLRFQIYTEWPEVRNVLARNWMMENIEAGIYLFSDHDCMFVDPDEEFAYIAGCMSRYER